MRFKKYLLFIILQFFLCNVVFAQKISTLDSLKITTLIDSSKECYARFNLTEANSYVRKAKAIAKEKGCNRLFVQALFLQGNITDASGDFDYAIILFKQALDYAIKLNNAKNLASIYGAIGLTNSKRANYAEALDYFFKALKMHEQQKDELQIANTLANMSVVFWGQEQYDKALEYLKKSTDIRIKHNDKSGIAYNYGNEALFYSAKKEVEKAIKTYQKTIALCEELNDINCLCNAYNNLGIILEEKGDYITALEYQKKALAFRITMQDHNGMAASYTNIGEIYLNQNNLDEALKNAIEGMEYAEETSSWEDIKDGALLLAKCYETKKDFKSAMKYYKKSSDAKDSIFNSLNTEQITRAQMNYEFEKKQHAQMLQEQKTQNMLTKNKSERNLILLLLISSIIVIVLIYRNYKIESKSNKKLIEKNDLLLDLNRERDALTKIVAHNLKTPMGQVKGLAQLIEMTGPLNEEQKEVLGKMNKSVLYGNKLIENLLNVNKLEVPNWEVTFAKINLNKMLNAVIEHNKSNAQVKNINIEFSNKFNGEINTNEEFLSEIIDNLLSNAIKFTNGGRKVFLNCFDKPKHVFIEVRDEGPGFSIDDKVRLFVKYQKLSARPTGGERSTGLGLYIVKLLADKINVKVNLESTQYQGSLFTIAINK